MPESLASVARWDVPSEHVLSSSAGRGWHGMEAAEIVHPLDDFTTPAIDRHVLVFNLGAAMVASERRSGRAGQFDRGWGTMILPAGRARDWHIDHHGEARHLHVYVDPDLVRAVAAEDELDGGRVELEERLGAPDPELVQRGLEVLRELRAPAPAARLAADALATLIAVQLLRQHASWPGRGAPGRVASQPALPAAALRRATDYIEAHLAEDLGLAELAAAAGFGRHHFARLFKTATGSSPHQYVIGRRVARARLLLSQTDWPIDAVAREVGFASGSHLAQHVRRRLGVNPSGLR